MKKKAAMIILIAVILIFTTLSGVLADQMGNLRWCNQDEYGCYVTEEDGSKSYIKFWSEEARKLFMGDESDAGELVFAQSAPVQRKINNIVVSVELMQPAPTSMPPCNSMCEACDNGAKVGCCCPSEEPEDECMTECLEYCEGDSAECQAMCDCECNGNCEEEISVGE